MFLILIGLLKKFVFKDLKDDFVIIAILVDIGVLAIIAVTIIEVYGC